MATNSEISQADFIAACCTVATVLADGWWKEARVAAEPIKRPAATLSAALDCQTAAKYCGFGRTKFRELVASGLFPRPVTIEARKRWLVKDLDLALAKLAKQQRQ